MFTYNFRCSHYRLYASASVQQSRDCALFSAGAYGVEGMLMNWYKPPLHDLRLLLLLAIRPRTLCIRSQCPSLIALLVISLSRLPIIVWLSLLGFFCVNCVHRGLPLEFAVVPVVGAVQKVWA